MLIENIRAKVSTGCFEYSQHALDQSIMRAVSVAELVEAIEAGAVIEDYPQDKYGPSCLVLGVTKSGRPLHVQCSYPTRPILKIITLYEPSIERWIDLRTRRT